VAGSANDQLITSGLRNSLSAPTIGTITGIFTDPNFRVALQALAQRSGVEQLAEPEVTTISGRQTQMKATTLQSVVTSFSFEQGASGVTGGGTGAVP
jgi:Flp pilus assembly secretin CpaC